jgi:DNA topoisomerase I
MPRLRRVDCAAPGISRRRRGNGFEYLDESTGERIEDGDVVERIRALAIPPAWQDVWICADPLGHIQATGIDARGRKQYRYHDLWRERRDREKFDDMVDFARSLPMLRERVVRDLRRRKISRERVLACAVRLLDRGFFRIGSEEYTESFGLATMRKEHVSVGRDGEMVFDYPAKSGVRRVQAVVDPQVAEIVAALKRRRGAARSCSPSRRAGVGATRARTTSTSTSRGPPATTSRPRTSGPGTRPCWPPSRCRSAAR